MTDECEAIVSAAVCGDMRTVQSLTARANRDVVEEAVHELANLAHSQAMSLKRLFAAKEGK